MSIFKCKMCGGTLEINNNESVATCEYCGTQQTLPKLNDDRRANLYDRANHFRRNNEFDKAMGIYEQILNEDNTDAEAYWSIVLCRYGIEYVEDPSSRKRILTVKRAQFTSIFDDNNYKSALQYADTYQKVVYEKEAKVINEIQKGMLAISQQEEPFDVFICYKETDNNGHRTPDSVLAQDLYYQLTQEGFKVFFSRITLEDKLGSAYEPYIFAALNSAKVMVALGTKPEYFNAVWVKNEWSRYLSLIKQGQKKILIPAYKDMDPYDLPEEFAHLQAQDMAKLGYMQDMIRGITKIVQAEAFKVTAVKSDKTAQTAPLLKRAFQFLKEGDWNNANDYCEKVLNIDSECAEAYLGKLLADLKLKNEEMLISCEHDFSNNPLYLKVIQLGDLSLVRKINNYIEQQNRKSKANRKKKIITILASGVCIIAIVYALISLVLIPNIKYRNTLSLLRTCEVSDFISLGKYEQDHDTRNGKEDIEWIVLAKEENRILVISRNILDYKPYHTAIRGQDVTWSNSYLRSWLNSDFIDNAFSSKEQSLITETATEVLSQDKLFILNESEKSTYRLARLDKNYLSTYYDKGDGTCWLRNRSENKNYFMYYNRDSSNNVYGSACTTARGVRPAMWIDLNA